MAALLSFKDNILSDPSSFFAAWDPATNTNYCSWPGVKCTNNTASADGGAGPGEVTSLLLDSLQLKGKLTTRLADLPYLKYINVSNNSFHGPIPTSAFCSNATIAPPQLTYLDLSTNSFTGAIPSSIGNCTKLVYLDLSVNALSTETFPNFLTSLTSIIFLDLAANPGLSGQLPTEIGRLRELQFFRIYDANLTGSLPPSLIANCTLLTWLGFSDNSLSGQLPQVDWTPLAGTLQQIIIDNNPELTGPIPPSIGNCTLLSTISFAYSKLTGSIPDSLGQLALLQELTIFNNSLSGSIPASILTNCTLLNAFEVANNNFSGSLPAEIGQLNQLQFFTFTGNTFLEGSIPDNIGVVCPQLLMLTFEDTSVGGSLPLSLFNLTELQILRLSSANFKGTLSPLIGNLSNLQDLRLGNNDFLGPIPGQLGNLSNLVNLFLQENRFVGFIPLELGNLKSLQGLKLRENQFTGPMPHELSGCTHLTELDCSFNPLIYGSIPSTFAQLQFLTRITLQQCNISGNIPDIFSSLKNLESVNLADNHLIGTIPFSLANLATLSHTLDLSSNSLSGSIPASLGKMNLLSSFNLSSNNFTGPIPAALGGCESLLSLDVSFNHLNHHIPPELHQLTSLQYLNLSHSELSGSLPYSMGNLSQLTWLDVSYNNIGGPIPNVGIYKNQTAFQFSGNPNLCGYPTENICPTGMSSSNPKRRTKIITTLSVTCTIGLVILITGLYFWLRKQNLFTFYRGWDMDAANNATHGSDLDLHDIQQMRIKAWKAKDLRLITNGFDSRRVIGSGGTSVCYKGTLGDLYDMDDTVASKQKEVVLVKRLSTLPGGYLNPESRRSFVNELKTICRMKHRNLVKVLGYCVEGGEVALVMEFMERGDLHQHLHHTEETQMESNQGQAIRMRWEDRVNVVLDVAEGLVYMHHEYEQPIVHCDIKPKNILLGSDMVAKISDFGIAKLIDRHNVNSIHNSTDTKKRTLATDVSLSRFRGTFGYAAPEYAGGLHISTQADVYSFGILLIEIITGMSPTSSAMQEQGTGLHMWALLHLQNGRIWDILDKEVWQAVGEDPMLFKQAEAVLRIGVKCSCPTTKDRLPSMRVIRDALIKAICPTGRGPSYPNFPSTVLQEDFESSSTTSSSY